MVPSHKHNISPENKLIHAPLLLAAHSCLQPLAGLGGKCLGVWLAYISVVEFYFGVRKISVMRVNVYSRNVSI